MRRQGASLRDVARRFTIPNSTLHYWFRNITLSPYHVKLLKRRADRSLITARVAAVKWHNAQKARRLQHARSEALVSLDRINLSQKEIIELALAFLYLGEGAKKNSYTGMGNSDPRILRFFVDSIVSLYGVPRSQFKCHLHLRSDQDPVILARYWSRTLVIPLRNFNKPLIDKRTIGSATFPHYKGVCSISCSHVEIQRKLMYIATTFCDTYTKSDRAVSSLGRAHR